VRILNEDDVYWVKVEPISFIIKNWNDMPKSINFKGHGKAKFFDLRAEEAIISNIPFYKHRARVKNSPLWSMWQNSTIRGFLNGINVNNITENGVPKFGAAYGGDFTRDFNFLNEAFNLSREPMIEYTISEGEESIGSYAFAGCVSLKKLVIPPSVKKIDKKAFEDLKFKYLYRTQDGQIILSQELLKDEQEYSSMIETGKIFNTLVGIDYYTLLKDGMLDKIEALSQKLEKNNFRIPAVFGLKLIRDNKEISFLENNDFRFFKNEIPNINELLLKFPEEERLDFFKFANVLGCFSTEKVLDKNGKETEVILAQRATSLLIQLMKTEDMKLRQISSIV